MELLTVDGDYAPRARSPRIGVAYVGMSYDVLAQIDELEVIEIAEVGA